MIIEGAIASHNRDTYRAQIKIDDKTGLISNIANIGFETPDYTFSDD